MNQPEKFERHTRARVGGSALEGGRWHGRLIALVALLSATLLIVLIGSASLDPPPPPPATPSPAPTPALVATAAHPVAWVQQGDTVTRWDSSGGAAVAGACHHCAQIVRPGQPPLFGDYQNTTRAVAIYDPLDGSTRLLELFGEGLSPRPLVSPDGQRLVLQTFDARGEYQITLGDLASGAISTVLDRSMLSAEETWMLQSVDLRMWDGAYLYAQASSRGRHGLWLLPLAPGDGEERRPTPEVILDLPMIGDLALDPVFGRTAYITQTADGGTELRVRDLGSGGVDRAIASDVYELSPISPDGSLLVYRVLRRGAGNGSQQLVLYNLNTGQQHTLLADAATASSAIRWSRHGGYLLLLYPESALILGRGENTTETRVPLPPGTIAAEVTSGAELVTLSYADKGYYLTIQPWNNPEARRVIPLGTAPATLVYVP